MKLYDAALSGNCHKVRLLLSMLELTHEVVPISLPDLEQKTPVHLARSLLGTVPVLEDGDAVIYDSQAILVYLARKYCGEEWLPTDATGLATVFQWKPFPDTSACPAWAAETRFSRNLRPGPAAWPRAEPPYGRIRDARWQR